MLISETWNAFEADKRIEGFSPQTLKAYQIQSTLLIKHLNDVEIDTIDTQQLNEYLAEASQNLKPSSLAHGIRFIRSIFRWLHEEGYINSNPACLNPMEKALFEFMFSTGCRIGEIVTLNKNSINWTDRSATLEVKEIKRGKS